MKLKTSRRPAYAWVIFAIGILCTFLAFVPLNSISAEYKILKLNDSSVGKVYLSLGRTTVLNFPMKPNKVIVGNQGSFAVQYVDNDIAISPTKPGARSNLFVYVASRRFSFDLVTGPQSDSIIVVRDRENEPARAK